MAEDKSAGKPVIKAVPPTADGERTLIRDISFCGVPENGSNASMVDVKDGKIIRNGNDYAGWAHEVAIEEHVGFIDLNNIIADRYDALGEAAVEPLFADPHTHTSLAGAEINANAVVTGLKRLKDDPVAGDFSAKGEAVKP